MITAPQRLFWVGVAAAILSTTAQAEESGRPRSLDKGVHLLLDDHFIARSEGVERKVIQPERFLKEPVVTTALEHQNWQPFFTVLHEPSRANSFRLWFNADTVDSPADGDFFGVTGHLESADGVGWPAPYKRLEQLTPDGRVRFGANVIDDGPQHQPAAERYKMLYFDAGKVAGPRVAFSPDGSKWTLHEGGKPVVPTSNGHDIWSATYDPIRKRYVMFGKTLGPHIWTNREGKEIQATIRRYEIYFSQDFKTWTKPQMVFSPDEKDSGVTQWYGPAGFLTRGDLMIAFLRVLRDDLSPSGVPQEAIAANTKGSAGLGASGLPQGGSGMGYTVLAWSRDGETWQRDRDTDKFFEPDPQAGAWDHAMAWVGSATPVKDELYLYYAGYRWGHKYRHSVDRQIGLVKQKRDRFVAHQAGESGGTILTPWVVLGGESLALNVDAAKGKVLAQVRNAAGEPIAGYRFADCEPIASDSLSAPVHWKEPLSKLRGQTVQLEFSLTSARLFGLEVQ